MIYRYARSKILCVNDRELKLSNENGHLISRNCQVKQFSCVKSTFQPYIIQQILGQTKHKELLRSTSNANYTTIHLENA